MTPLFAGLAAFATLIALWPPPRLVVAMRWEDWQLNSAAAQRGLLATAVVAGALAIFVIEPTAPVVLLGIAGAFLLGLAGWLWRTSRRRSRTAAAIVETVELLDVLAASLRAGLSVDLAMTRAAEEFDVLVPVASVAARGGDVAAALRTCASLPGRSALAEVARAWLLVQRSGAPLAQVLTAVALAAREELQIWREVETAAAPARATARLLGVLPLGGLFIGAWLGADPLETVTTNFWVAVAVTTGVVLDCVGVWWVEHLVDRVGR